MNKAMYLALSMSAFALGCPEPKSEAPAPRVEGTTADPAKSPAQALKEAPLPVAEDYAEAAKTEVTKENLDAVLDDLEHELEAKE